MSTRSLRMFWWTLILFVPLLAIFSGNYAYQAAMRYGDNVSFASCPAVIAYPQEGPCVAALQQLLNVDPPYARIYHDDIRSADAGRHPAIPVQVRAAGPGEGQRRDDPDAQPACPRAAPGPGRGDAAD